MKNWVVEGIASDVNDFKCTLYNERKNIKKIELGYGFFSCLYKIVYYGHFMLMVVLMNKRTKPAGWHFSCPYSIVYYGNFMSRHVNGSSACAVVD